MTPLDVNGGKDFKNNVPKRKIMKAEFTEKFFYNEQTVDGNQKTIFLPFTRVSARAIIVRSSDGAILGALHHKDGKFALPGGAIDNGESPDKAILRELREEKIGLIGSDEQWHDRIVVDYFHGYKELNIWFLFIVKEIHSAPCEEIVALKWIKQDHNEWYPFIKEKILLSIKEMAPELLSGEQALI